MTRPPFDPCALALPLIARPLAQEAVALALAVFGDRDTAAIQAEVAYFLSALHHDKQWDDATTHDLETPQAVLDRWSSIDDAMAFMDTLGLSDDHPVMQRLMKTPEDGLLLLASVVLLLVYALHSIEADLMAEPDSRYDALTPKLNPYIELLHRAIVAMRTVEPVLDDWLFRLTRQQVASKGGRVRNTRFGDLHAHVVEKAQALYEDRPASQAARLISEGLDATWLNDAEGKPLLIDPLGRFTTWIREDRKTRR